LRGSDTTPVEVIVIEGNANDVAITSDVTASATAPEWRLSTSDRRRRSEDKYIPTAS
jgi:hypothetical protein